MRRTRFINKKSRRIIAIMAIALVCLTVMMILAGGALAGEKTITTPGGATVTTSEGMEAPKLDYTFVWWSFLITFGLLALYYVLVLRISDTEFKKIIDAHFGPRQDGR